MEEKPNYYAVIPSQIRYDFELRPNEKLLYGEITALANKSGECWATNNYFASLYQVNYKTISKWVQHLKNKGYIQLEMCYSENKKNIEKRKIIINGESIRKKMDTCTPNDVGGIHKKVEENNTSINKKNIINKNINISINNKRKYFNNADVNNLFLEFLEMRTKLKAINSERAIKSLLNILNKFDDKVKIEMINNSIVSSWKSVYPLKKYNEKNIIRRVSKDELKEIVKKYDN